MFEIVCVRYVQHRFAKSKTYFVSCFLDAYCDAPSIRLRISRETKKKMIIVLALTSLTLYLAYRWSVATFDYFERRRVPFVKPVPLFGTMWPFVRGRMNTSDCVSEGYRLFRGSRFSGQFTFRKPGYLIHDLELAKEITVKDFDHFVDHSFTFSPELDPLMGRALIFTDGNRWKRGRSGLSPAFTGSKMRNMFELITNYSERAMKRLRESANGGKIEREMRDLFQRYVRNASKITNVY